LSFPVVMVSTAMQGGCTCENASLLRVNTGNIEFAALFAPKPQGMNSADDWTKEMAAKGFPELQKLYALYGAKDKVFLQRGEHFPHNYNAVTRSAFYTFLNKHFKLGQPSPVIERDFEPLTREQLSVWDDAHPAPKAADPDFERKLLQWLTEDAETQLCAAAATPKGLRELIGGAVQVLIGRTFGAAGEVQWSPEEQQDRGDYSEMTGTLLNKTYGEQVKLACLCPKRPSGRAVVWLDDSGRSALRDSGGSVKPAVMKLVQAGAMVVGADLLFQGGEPVKQTRVVENPREFAGFTFGYNHALFAQRTHDVLSIVSLLHNANPGPQPNPKMVAVAGWGGAGPIVAAARALAREAIDRAAVDTGGFRFGKLLDYRDPMFLSGGAKYLDLPGMIALGAPHPLWLAGEAEAPEIVTAAYRNESTADGLTAFTGAAEQQEASAVDWLLK
ncbi:MAG: acetylxylan esterase, partial [Pirellulales bacterium]|nr:acetylxylan esterase [Pirellulales bacterium]